MKFLAAITLAIAMTTSTLAWAGGHSWKSVDEQSSIAFGSVKKDTVGEVHSFSGVKGTVSDEGAVEITIDLGSVETNIDIRNERMAKHVFQDGAATAKLTGTVDMEDVSALSTGDVTLADLEGTLVFAGTEVDVEAEMVVARLAENRVLVTTANMLMLSTEDLGIDEGVDALMELAKLPGITRVTPITVRMVFEK